MRRIYDDRTAPEKALVIDAELASVDWDDPSFARGQTAYRRFEEGRWVVGVTGAGAFALRRVGPVDDVELVNAPAIRDFNEMDQQARAEVDALSMGQVLRRFFTGK